MRSLLVSLDRYSAFRKTVIDAHVQSPMLKPPPFGALTPLWAATSPEASDYNGKVNNPIIILPLINTYLTLGG